MPRKATALPPAKIALVHVAKRRLGMEDADYRTILLRVAGVDMLRSKRGPLVLEVNSSPGLEGIEAATGVDVADCIVSHVVALAQSRGNEDRTPI